MNKIFVLCMLAFVTACASKAKPVIENNFALQTEKFTSHGLEALHGGRISSAEKSLQHALRSAWLSSDLTQIARAQFHLGAFYLAQSKDELALGMLSKAKANAKNSTDNITLWRSSFALALFQQERGLNVMPPPPLLKEMPEDVYLSAARLAHLQGRLAEAKQMYDHVSQTPVSGVATVYNHAQAYLGLALLARDELQKDVVRATSDKTLILSKQAGFPVLAAHALLLQGEVFGDALKLERALHTYEALEDMQGQHDALGALLKLAESGEDEQRMHQWQQALKNLKQ